MCTRHIWNACELHLKRARDMSEACARRVRNAHEMQMVRVQNLTKKLQQYLCNCHTFLPTRVGRVWNAWRTHLGWGNPKVAAHVAVNFQCWYTVSQNAIHNTMLFHVKKTIKVYSVFTIFPSLNLTNAVLTYVPFGHIRPRAFENASLFGNWVKWVYSRHTKSTNYAFRNNSLQSLINTLLIGNYSSWILIKILKASTFPICFCSTCMAMPSATAHGWCAKLK